MKEIKRIIHEFVSLNVGKLGGVFLGIIATALGIWIADLFAAWFPIFGNETYQIYLALEFCVIVVIGLTLLICL